MSISPLSFSSTRSYTGPLSTCGLSATVTTPSRSMSLFAQPVAGEAAHLDVLIGLGDRLLHELPDRLVGVAHPRLIEQAGLLGVLLHAPLDDLVDDALRLALAQGLLPQLLPLGVELLRGDAVQV